MEKWSGKFIESINKKKTYMKLCPSVSASVTQMYPEYQYKQFPDLGDVIPPERLARSEFFSTGRFAMIEQAVIFLNEVERY